MTEPERSSRSDHRKEIRDGGSGAHKYLEGKNVKRKNWDKWCKWNISNETIIYWFKTHWKHNRGIVLKLVWADVLAGLSWYRKALLNHRQCKTEKRRSRVAAISESTSPVFPMSPEGKARSCSRGKEHVDQLVALRAPTEERKRAQGRRRLM